MTLHYMDGGEPFGTTAVNSGAVYAVLCYELNTGTFFAVRPTGETFWGTAACFDPPPPVPAAARKPEVGEVWIINPGGLVRDLVRLVVNSTMNTAGEFKTLCPDGIQGTWDQKLFQRPPRRRKLSRSGPCLRA